MSVPHSFLSNQADVALARLEKERMALERLQGLMRRFRDFEEVVMWLYREHGMYVRAPSASEKL
jgi:hypothetical protein